MELRDLLLYTIDKQASDLHLTENMPPLIRVNGSIKTTDFPMLDRENTKQIIYSVLSNDQKEKFEQDWELDLSLSLPGLDRFRMNVHIQRGSIEAAFRRIPLLIPTFDELGLPRIAAELARKPNGLVLVTGPTGSGKTTTLAAMVDLINSEREGIIISIEDPI